MRSQAIVALTEHPQREFGNTTAARLAQPTHKRAQRRRRESVTVVNNVLRARAREHDLGTWTLEAHHAGDVSLMLDGKEVASIAPKHAGPMVAGQACPYVRASEIIAALTSGLAIEIGARTRGELEVLLARWIPLYFDL